MKFNFKKIVSVLTSTVMLSSTLAFAAAANFPAPFVSGGSSDVAIVYGGAAGAAGGLDYAAVININADLSSAMASGGVSSSPTTVTGGDYIRLDKSNDRLHLGDALNDVYTSLDNDKLKTVLADGVYEDDDGNDNDYEQKIELSGNPINITHFADDEVNSDEKPVIGFDIPGGSNVLNYTLTFTDTPLNNSMDDTNINMLGRDYYISTVEEDGGELMITLLDSANTRVVYEGTPETVTVGGQTFTVELVSADTSGSTDKATLMINGEKIDPINLGNSKKIAGDTYLSVTDVFQGTREKDLSYAEFSLGTGKIVIKNGANVEMNDDQVDELTASITQVSGGEVSKIKLIWTTEDEEFLVPGMDLSMPGLGAVKLSMGGFQASGDDMFTIKNSGDDYIQLSNIELLDGSIDLPLLRSNSSTYLGLGKDADNRLATSGGLGLKLNESQNTRFVATWISGDDFESHAFELVSVNEVDSGLKNETTLKDLATGETTLFTDTDDTGDDKDFGNINIAVTHSDGDLGRANVTISALGSGTAYTNRLVTAEGLLIRLPVAANVSTTEDGNVEFVVTPPTSLQLNITEADEDGNVGAGKNFTVTLGHSSDGPQVSSISPSSIAVEDGSDDAEAYIRGPHATKLLLKDADQDTLDVTYHGDEAYADVFIAEAGAVVSGSSQGSLAVSDSEVSSVSSKNLIVVGGSCVNSVAASLLGSSSPLCGADWQSKTGVGAGSFLIQTFASPYSSSKIATLVAGYNAPDTASAAKYLTTQTLDVSAAGNKITKTVAEVASLV